MSKRRLILRPVSRKAAICDLIEENSAVSVEVLAEKFNASLETIRRDLNALANEGRIRKVHGGAVKLSTSKESGFGERARQNTLAKQLIAEKLKQAISPGQTLMIDTGTTTLACADVLAAVPDLTVITNSLRVAAALSAQGSRNKVTILGGTYRHDNAQTVGGATVAEIGQYRVDHAILTVGTLDARGGYDFSEEEALVARAMRDSAQQVSVVADHSKLNRQSTYHVCGLEQIDRLVTDGAPDPMLKDILSAAGVEIL
jgi:DeoR family glycerol-3-phosphate regulon repressor